MSDDEITPAARALINRHIRSMDHAEAALHLAGEPDQSHDANAVAVRHSWARGVATQVLSDLTESGLAAQLDGRFRFLASSVEPSALADLAELYHRHPVALVRAIYSAPLPMKPLVRPATTADPPSPDR